MKTNRTKTHLPATALVALLFFCAPAALHAQFAIGTNDDGSITIGPYDGISGDVTIPSTTNGRPVTTIEAAAFYYCTSMTTVTLPGTITNIGEYAFASCINLTAITVEPTNPFYSSGADGVLFNKSQSTLIQCPGGKGGSYSVPDTVTNIGIWAFADCYSLTSVTIGKRVTSMEDDAFIYCFNLTNVTIPDGVTSIGNGAFDDCTSLATVTIPGSVTNIGHGAFYECTNLTTVTIPDSVTSIQDRLFHSCTSLTNVTIPNTVTSIGDRAFDSCTTRTMRTPGSTTGTKAPALTTQAILTISISMKVMAPPSNSRINRAFLLLIL